MQTTGTLYKMQVMASTPITYQLRLSEQSIPLNPAIGHPLTLEHTGLIHCIHCGRKTNKSFDQGYCYPCFTRLAQCDTCIIKPERCHHAQGTCREPEWGEKHCMQPHYVYLANSSGLKVGITRHTQIPTRWIDQGATQALPILKVPTRLISGLVEETFKAHVADKTQWQKMLKGEAEAVDLAARRDELFTLIRHDLERLREQWGQDTIEVLPDENVMAIHYPVENYPSKVNALNFDKTPIITGTLQGIKGQYLIFDSGVLNIRKFSGYQVKMVCEELTN